MATDNISSKDNGRFGVSPAKIRDLYDKGNQRRSEFDREAWTNIAFISGNQYHIWDKASRRFQAPNEDGRARLKVNLVEPFWRGEQAIVMESNPEPKVVPASDSDKDREGAIVANRILEHELRRLSFPLIRQDLFSWVLSCGMAYLHVWWNIDTKKIQVDVVPHFEVVHDPNVRTSIHEGLWVIHSKTLTVEAAYEMFGKELKPDKGSEVHDWSSIFSESNNLNTKPPEGVQVSRMWHKPSKRYPEGFVITVANEKIIEEKPFPFKHGELPFQDFHHIRLPGRYEGSAIVKTLIPVQRDYNQSRSRMAEIRTFLASPFIWAPEGSLDTDRVSLEPGEVRKYRVVGPFKPELAQMPQAPAHLFQTTQQAYGEMQDIAGQHDVSSGMSPGSGTPAAAIIALQEKDQRKIAATIRNAEVGWSTLGRQILGLAQQYWTEKQFVMVWSAEEGSAAAKQYAGSQINNQTDVYITPGSSEPRNKGQTAEMWLNLYREKVVLDPNHVLKALDVPGVSTYIQNQTVDERQAKREHDRIYDGQEVLVEKYMEHEVHIQVHNEFRKTEAFEMWPQELRNYIADHITQHEIMLQEIQMEMLVEQMKMQQMTMGGAPEEGMAPSEGVTPSAV